MNKERLQEIKDSIDFQREFLIASNMQTLCVDEEMELYNEIIRLQQENEQLKKQKDYLDDYNRHLHNENKQLENNRDKAIEYINCKQFVDGIRIQDIPEKEELLNILKGDSDE